MYVYQQQTRYLGTLPKFDTSKVEKTCTALQVGHANSIESLELCDAIYPEKEFFSLGVYEHGVFYGSRELLSGTPDIHFEKIKVAMNKEFPELQALVIQVNDTVNQFGYALFSGQNLIRMHYGNINNYITKEYREIQPEEKAFYDTSVVRNGARYFENSMFGETNTPAFGGKLVDALTARFLNKTLDQRLNEDFPLQVENFERR
jgi:hypothetical protein